MSELERGTAPLPKTMDGKEGGLIDPELHHGVLTIRPCQDLEAKTLDPIWILNTIFKCALIRQQFQVPVVQCREHGPCGGNLLPPPLFKYLSGWHERVRFPTASPPGIHSPSFGYLPVGWLHSRPLAGTQCLL